MKMTAILGTVYGNIIDFAVDKNHNMWHAMMEMQGMYIFGTI